MIELNPKNNHLSKPQSLSLSAKKPCDSEFKKLEERLNRLKVENSTLGTQR